MLLNSDECALIVVDIQERLMPTIENSDALEAKWQWCVKLANKVQVPILVTEQYPKGLGHTIKSVDTLIQDAPHYAKDTFSLMSDKAISKALEELKKPQLILMGIEAHVCVMQSAIELIDAGFDVYVISDAIGARAKLNLDAALDRMCTEGVNVVTSEMLLFEWCRKSGTDLFKELSEQFLKNQ